MRVAILAGGLGTRLSEETRNKPKPMVEIGGRPILWHIMRHFAEHGLRDFVIGLGYKGEVVKEYFLDYYRLSSDLRIDLATGEIVARPVEHLDWTVELVDTGPATNTGGRVKRLARRFGGEGTFLLAWGDGLTDLDPHDLLAFHRSHGRLVTMVAVRNPARFGHVRFDGDHVADFIEKPESGDGWINGGIFAVEPGIVDYVSDDAVQFEREPLERAVADGQLMAYRHTGFWHCMDTINDRERLEAIWATGEAPWAQVRRMLTA